MNKKELLKKALADAELIEKKLADEKDEKVKKDLQEALDAKTAEMETLTKELEAEVAKAEKKAKMDALLTKAADLSKTDVAGKPAMASAEAKNHEENDRILCKYFGAYLKDGKAALPGEALEALAPDPTLFKKGVSGLKAPRSLADKIVPKQHEGALLLKSLPMVSSSNAQGGYTVPQDFRELLQTPMPRPSIYDFITIVPSKTGTVTWPKLAQSDSNEFGSVSVTWTTEGSSKDATEAAFEQIQISTSELEAYTEISHALLSRSAVNLEQLLGTLFKAACRYELDKTILVGTGSGQPYGVKSFSGIHTVARNTAANVKWQDLVNLEGSLEPHHLDGAVYVFNNKALTNLKLQLDSQNRPLFVESTANGLYKSLNDYPYVSTTHLPTVGTTGDVLFGNFRQYIGVLEQDVVVRRSDDYKFQANCAAFAVFLLFGGKPIDGRLYSKLGTVNGS